MRNALVEWLNKKAKEDENIVLITGDLGYSVLESYIEAKGTKFLNAGVAEQNMTGIAAGLALEGLRPYTYSIGIFPTFRCAEQIRNDIDYHNLAVVICAIGSGVAYGNLGYSHHAIQDLALMRTMPNMLIATPCDPSEVKAVLNYQYENPTPMYLRTHKSGEPTLTEDEKGLKPGRLKKIWEGYNSIKTKEKKIPIICIGHIATRVISILKGKKLDSPVYSVPMWGSKWSKEFADEIKKYERIITVEDHVIEGGFGSYALEICALYGLKTKVTPIGFKREVIGKVAKEETLLKQLDDGLINQLKKLEIG